MRPPLLGVFVLAAAPALLAAPTVSHLLPSGARRGTTAEITIVGEVDPWPPRVEVTPPGLEVAFSKDRGKLSISVPEDAAPGLHWLRFFEHSGASDPRPFWVGVLPEALEVEPNDRADRAQRVDAREGIVVNGRLEKRGDVDIFAVELEAGATLVADLDANDTLGSPMDGVLQVASPDGVLLAHNDDDAGLDPRLVFHAPAAGVYLVRLFAFPATPNSSISFAGDANYVYRLTLTAGAFVDHVFPLAVSAGVACSVMLHGTGLGDAALVSLDAPSAPLIRIDRPGSGELRVVEHRTAAESSCGEVELASGPITISGRISSPGERDVIRVRASKGARLVASVEARELGSLLDPVLALRDGDGKTLATADDRGRSSRDPQHVQQIPADGVYEVELGDRFLAGGERHWYVLTLREEPPDFELGLASGRFVLTPGRPLEIPVSVTRSGGFSGEVTVGAEDLPDFVSCKPAVSAAKGDSAKKVSLVLEAAPESVSTAWSGAIRIAGRCDTLDLSREARPPMTGTNFPGRLRDDVFAARSPGVWLTVTVPAPAKTE